jgi:hypothetical protein
MKKFKKEPRKKFFSLFNNSNLSWAWQEDCEFKASLGYTRLDLVSNNHI